MHQMRFNPDLSELVPASQLDADFGGQNEYKFEPRSYWDAIVTYVHLLNPVALDLTAIL